MKLAHISDLHLSTFYKESNLSKISFLLRYALNQGFDHLAITGDITDNADDSDFEIMRSLFKGFGILHADRLSLVIGNHDIFGGVLTAEDILTYPERCRNTNYYEKVESFVNHFHETFEKCLYKADKVHFPYVKAIEDVMITGLNSIAPYSSLKNPFASNGLVCQTQQIDLYDIFTRFASLFNKKVILIHHYFNKYKIKKKSLFTGIWGGIESQTMKLKKKNRLFTLFKQFDIDIVLHGHLHENKEYERRGIRFMNAGACLKGVKKNEMQINFINFDHQKTITEIHKIRTNTTDIIRFEVIKKQNVHKTELQLRDADLS